MINFCPALVSIKGKEMMRLCLCLLCIVASHVYAADFRALNERVIPDCGAQKVTICWEYSRAVYQEGAKNMRFHFEVDNIPENVDFIIRVIGRSGISGLEITSDQLRYNKDYWSDLYIGEYGIVQLLSTDNLENLGIRFTGWVAYDDSDMVERYSIVGSDSEIEQFIVLKEEQPKLFQAGRAIAMITVGFGRNPRYCSGFLVTDSLLVTNNHCIKTEQECREAFFNFDYYVNSNNGLNIGRPEHRCQHIVETSSPGQLDYSLLQLNGMPGDTYGFLQLSAELAARDEAVSLIHHPNAETKKVTRKNCAIADVLIEDMPEQKIYTHICDSAEGSSGSPLINLVQEVVALHYAGIQGGTTKFRDKNRSIPMSILLERCPKLRQRNELVVGRARTTSCD